MNDSVWQAIVLGALQGLTEFLPISSSAHLILLPWLAGWKPMGLVFDVMVHGGTLAAVGLYFREDWRKLAIGFLRRLGGRSGGEERSLVDAIVVGTIPAILVALIFRDSIESHARQAIVTVVTLSVFGLLLWWADRKGPGDHAWEGLSARDGLLIGIAQSLALIPGVSRSGITMTAALLLGYSRKDSARFSFLLAGPIILLGSLDGLLELFLSSEGGQEQLVSLVLGIMISFLVGFFCIKYFLKFLEKRTFLPFVVYRLLLALVILLVWVV